MLQKLEITTADQLMSFADEYGDELQIFIANVGTSSFTVAMKTGLPKISGFPKFNDGASRIRIDVLYDAISDDAIKGTGLFFELYEQKMLSMLVEYAAALPERDRQIFIDYVTSKGHRITCPEYRQDVHQFAEETMSEIQENQI